MVHGVSTKSGVQMHTLQSKTTLQLRDGGKWFRVDEARNGVVQIELTDGTVAQYSALKLHFLTRQQ